MFARLVPRPPAQGGKWAGRFAATAGVGTALGWFFFPAPEKPTRSEPPSLIVGGHPVRLDSTADERALAWIRTRLSTPVSLSVPFSAATEPRFHYLPAALGIEIDRTRLRQFLQDVANPLSPTRVHRSRSANPAAPLTLLLPIRLNSARALPVLMNLKRRLDRPPRDARLDPHGGPPIKERAGRHLDIDASLLAIELAVEGLRDEAELVFQVLPARRLAAQLATVQPKVTLGSFETPYDRSRKSQARTFNLRLAASRLDRTVLLPGETFDFNKVVGPRDEAHGYQVASVIAQGEVVDGIGGGTCQISGTLHAAALFAGLEVLERHPHTRPSSYIKLGFDAAVVYPTMNLTLRNPHDFPVLIRETVNDGKVQVHIRGVRRPHRTTVIRKIDEALPYPQVERLDPTLPRGTRRIIQHGVPGLLLHRYRISQSGSHSVREKTSDHYPATAEVTRVGTDTSRPVTTQSNSQAHPEYLPEELLVMSQQNDPGAPLLIRREAGRYGTAGWTAKLLDQARRTGQ